MGKTRTGRRRHPHAAAGPRQAAASVVLAWISPGQTSHYFSESLTATALVGYRRGWLVNILTDWSSANVSAARNSVTARFLQEGHGEWLLWVDADMQWAPEAVEQLLAVADPQTRPIVGGLCFGMSPDGMFPTIYMGHSLPDGKFTTVRVRDYPRDSVVQVAATGAAFLLIHRSALEAIEARGFDQAFPWFAESSGNGKPVGEDITFCIRAGICGFPIFVHTGARIGHHKSWLLTEDEFERQLPPICPPSVGLVIPTRRDHPDLLRGILAASGLPGGRVVVVDTSGTIPDGVVVEDSCGVTTGAPGATVIGDTGPVNIHRWWNRGIGHLVQAGCSAVAVANDDLVISPETLPRLHRGLGAATLALATAEGPSGHLWMLNVTHGVRPDEAYRWYSGDLQLAADATEHGRGVVRVLDAWHLHLHPTEATESDPELQALAAADDELYDRRHSGGPHAATRYAR